MATSNEQINKLVNLENLLSLTCNGVFALVNEQDRKVDVRYGSNLLRSITAIVEGIKGNSVCPRVIAEDKHKLQLIVLETSVPNEGLCHNKWMNYYISNGYSLYRSKPGSKYSVVITIDYVPEMTQARYFFVVKLVSKAEAVIVGLFDNDLELSEFTEKYYKNGVSEIVFSGNIHTASYLSTKPVHR